MKKAVLIIVAAMLILVAVLAAFYGQNKEFLRIHIRANSNSNVDQEVKYAVRNAVSEYLTPLLVNISNKDDAEKIVSQNLSNIIMVADKVLSEKGFSYKSNARISREQFPTRYYGEYCLEEGIYDALIIELGDGTGDNWWCVIYPPLCFIPAESGTGNIYYKSKILEIIEDFFQDQE